MEFYFRPSKFSRSGRTKLSALSAFHRDLRKRLRSQGHKTNSGALKEKDKLYLALNHRMSKQSDDSMLFPQKLMDILADPRNQETISWLPDGKSFVIRDRTLFAEIVMPRYFPRKAKYSSFTRKLNRWCVLAKISSRMVLRNILQKSNFCNLSLFLGISCVLPMVRNLELTSTNTFYETNRNWQPKCSVRTPAQCSP